MKFQEIGNPTYIALETFRKSGEGVVTPVWVTAESGKFYVWTLANSGKAKRIRNNGRVRIAISDARGNPKSEWVEAKARVLSDPAEDQKQRERLAVSSLQPYGALLAQSSRSCSAGNHGNVTGFSEIASPFKQCTKKERINA